MFFEPRTISSLADQSIYLRYARKHGNIV